MAPQHPPKGLSNKDAAQYLSRQPQRLRKWAAYENGPSRPVRINDRLRLVAAIKRLLSGAAA